MQTTRTESGSILKYILLVLAGLLLLNLLLGIDAMDHIPSDRFQENRDNWRRHLWFGWMLLESIADLIWGTLFEWGGRAREWFWSKII